MNGSGATVSPAGAPCRRQHEHDDGHPGSGFVTGDLVYLNNVQDITTTVVSSNEITATAPITAASTVAAGPLSLPVMVQDSHGNNSPTNAAATFTYYGQPKVGGVSPIGQAEGSKVTQQVVITGTNFLVGGTTVNFGTQPATKVVVGSTSILTATSPAVSSSTSKTVEVQAVTLGGTSVLTPTYDSYVYAIAPTVSAVSVISGTDNITVTAAERLLRRRYRQVWLYIGNVAGSRERHDNDGDMSGCTLSRQAG